jgi:homogentisate 1,2-dioxygenase
MPYYVEKGDIPPKRHITHEKPDGGLFREEVFGTEGFDGVQSILYHHHPPLRTTEVGASRDIRPGEWDVEAHRHHHLRTSKVDGRGPAHAARKVLAHNDHCTLEVAAPTEPMEGFYRNATADELWFVHEGSGTLETVFGEVPYEYGDYIHVPRGTTYRFPDARGDRFLVVTSPGPIQVPSKYRNEHGQLMEGSPYSERDLHPPSDLVTRDEEGEFDLTVRVDWEETPYVLDRHPFDVVGWDGCHYPYTFNIQDFEPITGKIHQPPPVHATFEGPGFMVGSFCPRKVDYHEDSIPAPYYHANIDTDEILYYVEGDFQSRKGITEGSITLHRRGLHHGPQPGIYEESVGTEAIDEYAVMVESEGHFQLTEHARGVDDGGYPYSWVEDE